MEERSDSRRERLALVALSAAVVLAFLFFLLSATDGHFVPQVVDLYVVCQYAKAMAEGHPFQYNPGEAASTGATSLLHTALLAAAYAVGFRGEGLVAFAILSGAACFSACVFVARRIGVLLAGERVGLLAGALCALGGPVAWGFLYGSDVGLAMFLAAWLFERLLAEWNGPTISRGVLAATLLALARPEGLPIGLALGVAWSLGPARDRRGGARLLPWLPAAAGLAVSALYRGLTGYWLGTSVTDKSLLANYTLADSAALVAEYGMDVLRGLLLGFYPSQAPIGFARGWAPFFFPPLALILILLVMAHPPERLAAPLRLWGGIVAVLYAFVAPNMFMGVHFSRYLMWAFPTLLALCAAGIGTVARLPARGEPAAERSLFRAVAALALAFGALSTLRFATLYGELAGEVYRRDVAAALWITNNLPRGARIANLATSVEFLTGHRNMNLHGVTSPAFFGGRASEREAALFESLGRLRADERPEYLLSTVSTQESLPALAELVAGPPLYRTSSFSDEIVLYRMRYDLVGKSSSLYMPETLAAVRGLAEVDHLDICDGRDETAHAYTFRSGLGNLRLLGTARVGTYDLASGPEKVVEGGRLILGGESFEVSATPAKDLVVVMRTAASAEANIYAAPGNRRVGLDVPEAGMVVEADGQRVGRFTFRPHAGWDEVVFRVPASLVRRDRLRVSLSGRYASFHYWFFQ